MMTVTEHLRECLLSSCGLVAREPKPDLDTLRATEWCPEFEQAMRNRLVMGVFRYGLMKEKRKKKFDLIGNALQRLQRYQQAGEMEDLVDVANLCLLEFDRGLHQGKTIHPTDDGLHCTELDGRERP